MRLPLLLLLTVSLVLADLPSCSRARCPHCSVEFIARMCPGVCSSCTHTSTSVIQQSAAHYDAKSGAPEPQQEQHIQQQQQPHVAPVHQPQPVHQQQPTVHHQQPQPVAAPPHPQQLLAQQQSQQEPQQLVHHRIVPHQPQAQSQQPQQAHPQQQTNPKSQGQPHPRSIQPLPAQPAPVYQTTHQPAPVRPQQNGVPIAQSAQQQPQQLAAQPQPQATQPLYPQHQQTHLNTAQRGPVPSQQAASNSGNSAPQYAQQPQIPPSPTFNPQPTPIQPLNLPPPPPGIAIPPYNGLQQQAQGPPQSQQPQQAQYQQPPQQQQQQQQYAAPSPPQPQPQQQPAPTQQTYTGNYGTATPINNGTPTIVQPSLPQHQPLNAYGQPFQPFGPQPFGAQPFGPQPFGQPPHQLDLFNPVNNRGLFPGVQQNPFFPGASPPGINGGLGGAPGLPGAAQQQSALFNPFAPFLGQGYPTGGAGGVTPDPLHLNPFALPGFTLTPTTTTPPPLKPLAPAPSTFYDARQQGLVALPSPGGYAGQPQYNQTPYGYAQQGQQSYQQQPPVFQMPGLPPMPGLPQIPNMFGQQPTAPAPVPRSVPTDQTAPQPAPQPQSQLAQQPQAAPVQQPQQQPAISQSIDAPAAAFDKHANTFIAPGADKGATEQMKQQPQCPTQPGWGACVTKQLANERFRNCCAPLGEGCLPLCDYDATLTNMQLAVLTGRCPLAKVGDVMVCASGYEDATPCCQAYGVFEPGYEHCRPYCNPSAGIPEGGLLSEKYKCLVKLTLIQQCFYVTQKP